MKLWLITTTSIGGTFSARSPRLARRVLGPAQPVTVKRHVSRPRIAAPANPRRAASVEVIHGRIVKRKGDLVAVEAEELIRKATDSVYPARKRGSGRIKKIVA